MNKSINSNSSRNKRDITALIALIIAFTGMLWAVFPVSIEQYNQLKEEKEASRTVVDIAKSIVNAAKETKESSSPAQKTLMDHIIQKSFFGSLSIAAISFVLSIIAYVLGAKKRVFRSTMLINIITVGINVFWVAIAIAIIYVAIRFLDVVGID